MRYLVFILSLSVLLAFILANEDINQKLVKHKSLINGNNDLLQIVIEKVDTIDKKIDIQTQELSCITTKRSEPISGIIRTDVRGIIQDVSEGIEQLTNKDENELIGSSLSILIPPEEWNNHADHISKVAQKGKTGVLISQEIKMCSSLVEVQVSYIATEEIFIINMKEI